MPEDPLYQAMNGMSVLPLYDRFKEAGITASDVNTAFQEIGAPGRQQALLESAAIKEKLVAAEGADYPHNLWIRAYIRGATLAEVTEEQRGEAQPAAPAATACITQKGDATGWQRAFAKAAEAAAAVDSWDSAFAKAANN